MSHAERAWRWCRHNPALASALVLVVLAGFAGVTTFWLQAEAKSRIVTALNCSHEHTQLYRVGGIAPTEVIQDGSMLNVSTNSCQIT